MGAFEDLAKMATFRPVSSWPGQRTDDPQASRFEASWSDTVALLTRELDHLDAQRVVVEIDGLREQDLRLDGLPRANARFDAGVVVSFESRHGPLRYACDRFVRPAYRWKDRTEDWQHNLRAVALGLEALRKVERYGITERGEQYRGFLALEMGSGDASALTLTDALSWLAERLGCGAAELQWSVEGNPDGWERTVRKVRALTHPDRHGGDQAEWDRGQEAIAVVGRWLDRRAS